MGNAAIAGILALGIGIIIVSLVLSIAVYVVCAYAQYKALKFMGYDKPWMGWIPYASNYAMADAIGEENVELLGRQN